MLELFLNVLEMVVMATVPVLTGYLIKYLSTKAKDANISIEDAKIDKYAKMLEETIDTCVLATTQTYVDSMKKQGSFDAEAQSTAFGMTKETILSLLTIEAKKYLTELYGDLDGYLNQRIEARVQTLKK